MSKGKHLLVVLLVLTMIVGGWLAGIRHLLENNDRQVEIAVDARLLVGNHSKDDHSLPEKLLKLQEAGCTAVAVNPLSLNELERNGELIALTPALYLVTGEEGLGERLQAALSPFLPDVELKKRAVHPATATSFAGDGGAKEYQLLSLPGHFAPVVKELPLLLPREQMLIWQRAGLQVVPLFNYPSRLSPLMSEKYWEVLARQLQELKHTAGIQFGPVVFPAAAFSYPAPQGATTSIFKEGGFSLGTVEFTEGRGLTELAAVLDYRLLRTHQIPGAELAQLGTDRARERFLRAVQERKVRLLLLQPFPELDPRSAWDSYLPLIRDLAGDLRKAGFPPGTASFSPDYQPPAAALALLGAGIAAAAIILAGYFFSTGGENTGKIFAPLVAKTAPPGQILGPAASGSHTLRNTVAFFSHVFQRNAFWLWPLAGTIFIFATAGFLLAGEHLPFYTLGRQLAALAAALIFPLLSTLFFLEPALPTLPATANEKLKEELFKETNEMAEGGGERKKRIRLKKNGLRRQVFLKELTGRFLLASLLTTGGALLAAGLLSSTPFLLKIEFFRGVKIAQAGPFLLFALWFLLQGGQSLWRAGRDFLETRLQIKHFVLLALAGGILLIYFLRGGNTSFLPVSGWELALRRRLEMLLVARPRFKEFLIGHPGFFLFAALAARHWRGSWVLALLLGLLGQISLFNTFMHLHRPVGLSLLGTAYGAGLGLLGGLVLYGLATAVARRWPAAGGGGKNKTGP